MKKCWKLSPSERTSFSELVATLDKTLMSVAGYTELSMTLVAADHSEEYEDVQPPRNAVIGKFWFLLFSFLEVYIYLGPTL